MDHMWKRPGRTAVGEALSRCITQDRGAPELLKYSSHCDRSRTMVAADSRATGRDDLSDRRARGSQREVSNPRTHGAVIVETHTMDAGIAALLGTALGSTATLGAAILSGHLQSRSQHEQARRLYRRDAYTKYLGALHDRDIAMDAILGALQPEAPRLDEVDEKVSLFITLARDVHRAAEVVILEGPSHVIEAAEQVTHASADLSEVMQRMVENARSGNDARKAADNTLAREWEHRLYETVQSFRAIAREALGNAE
jgi:hypothetical protein